MVDRLGTMTRAEFDTEELDEAGREYVARVDELVADDEELAGYVEELREASEEEPLTDDPAGATDELVAEVEDFLRDVAGDDA